MASVFSVGSPQNINTDDLGAERGRCVEVDVEPSECHALKLLWPRNLTSTNLKKKCTSKILYLTCKSRGMSEPSG